MKFHQILTAASVSLTLACPALAEQATRSVREIAKDVSMLCYEVLDRNERLTKQREDYIQQHGNDDASKERLRRLDAELRWSKVQLVNEGCHRVFAMEELLSGEAGRDLPQEVNLAIARASYCDVEGALEGLRTERAALNRKIDSLGSTANSGAAMRGDLLRQMDILNEKVAAYGRLDDQAFCAKSTLKRTEHPAEWRIQQCLMASAGVAAVQSTVSDARQKLETAYAHRRTVGKSRVLYVEFDERGYPTQTLEAKKREVQSFIAKERREQKAYEIVMSELSCLMPPA